MVQKLTNLPKVSNQRLLLSDMSKVPKVRLSFKYYEEKYQIKKLEELQADESKTFVRLIARLHNEDVYTQNGNLSLNRGKTGKNIKSKLKNHEWIEEMIHLGKGGSFRLHGVLRANVFYLICIDPNHKIHTSNS